MNFQAGRGVGPAKRKPGRMQQDSGGCCGGDTLHAGRTCTHGRGENMHEVTADEDESMENCSCTFTETNWCFDI